MTTGAGQHLTPLVRYTNLLLRAKLRSIRRFFAALILISCANTIPSLVRSIRRKHAIRLNSPINPSNIKTALFPAIIPEIYAFLKRYLAGYSNTGLPELLSTPWILLLPSSLRLQGALYAVSAALFHTGEKSSLRRSLPPAWTLNVIGNACLLWAFLFRSKAFPKTYESIILSHSTRYVPKGMPKPELEAHVLSHVQTKSEGYQGPHQNSLCAKLHPNEPSCILNYLKAMAIETPRAGLWVGAFSLLPIIMSKARLAMIKSDPSAVLKGWATTTLRGSAFVVGSINTSWAMVCLCQRLLPQNSLKHTRWLISGAIGSLWILILPAKRRTEFALYVARLVALCAWRIWRIEGGASIPYGDVLLFAFSWAYLARLRAKGTKVTGLVGIGMKQLDTLSGIKN